jgi:lipopolysaccharide/colanic/teichoic acid biosynthesis glycosyltransferase
LANGSDVRIDELPQLWNVLRGEMSLVGPRPEQPCFVTLLESQIPYYAERHMVKPGITGWAQVNYPYGANVSDVRAKLEYDLYYAKNYSLFLDVEIILKTFRVILVPQGVR